MNHPFAPHDNCRLARCKDEETCKQLGVCDAINDNAFEYRQWMTGDCMPSLRHILKMIDSAQPVEHVRVEVQALLMRCNRTI